LWPFAGSDHGAQLRRGHDDTDHGGKAQRRRSAGDVLSLIADIPHGRFAELLPWE
jgi:hypothetical protein